MSEVTHTEIVKSEIEYYAQGDTNKDITRNILNEWRDSQPILDMQEAEMYYKVQNTEIEKKTRSYKDEAGQIIQNENLSNIKSKTAQYRKSVNQKLNYALAKPFTISCDNEKYQQKWEEFLTPEIRAVIQRVGKDGINKGIGWVYPWINELGNLEIVDIQPETLYPAWHDTAHTELDTMVRDYMMIVYEGLSPRKEYKVEYWDRQILEKYIDYSQGEGTNGDLVPDTNGEFELSEGEEERATIQQTHMRKQNGEGISWDRVPFIFFKGCQDELPLLNECRTDIDSYDMVKSKAIDSILDDIDAVLVVENISSEIGELSRARKMLQNSRIMVTEPGGSAHFEKVNADIQAIAQELDLIKKDVQDNTSTVDVTTIKLGTNPSGEAMKSFFEPLNTWCNGYETEFRVFMKNLKYFFDKWLSWQGGFGSFEQLQDIPITFTLVRDMMINESELFDNINKMADQLSQQTLDEHNPWVENYEKEQQRRDDEEKEMQKKEELYKFENDTNKNNNNLEENEDEEQENNKNDRLN